MANKGNAKMSEFHKRIKSERLRAGLKQQEVADKLEITRQSYARYENGAVNQIDIDFAAKVCEILNTSPDYLFCGKRTITDTLELWHLVRDVESDIEKIKVMLKGN
jgi:transcriptional regulator with XRE-family HTH domain